MAKAILEFDLSNEDDSREFSLHMKASSMYVVLWEFDQYLRSQLKYNDNITPEAYDALDKARERLYELKNERGVNLDDM